MTTRPSDRATTLTTPEALELLAKVADDIGCEYESTCEQLESIHDHLASRIAELEGELAAVRANAERYVWLRESPSAGVEVMTDDGIRSLSESELDAAIDAARGAG